MATPKKKLEEKDPLLDEGADKTAPVEEAAPPKGTGKPPKVEVDKPVAEKEVALPVGVKEVVDVAQYNRDRVEATKKKLWAGPTTSFLIPLMPGEKPGASEMVNINGYQLTIKKGSMVTIPVPVANILANHYSVEMNAGREMAVDRKEDVADALA